jgi:hypothetical protein
MAELPIEEFKIHGRSRDRVKANEPTSPSTTKAPPTGPKALLAKLHVRNFAAPTGPSRRDRERLGEPSPTEPRSAGRDTTPSSAVAKVAVDPHTLEREARNRERLLKEQQRRQQLSGSGGGRPERKRGWADASAGDGDGNGSGNGDGAATPSELSAFRDRRKKGRRMNYKYEDEENDEMRARRVEHEREAQRWN